MGEFHSCKPARGIAMSLLQYWPTSDEINTCIKHEAEGAHDAVLLAVHRPSPLTYKLISSGEKFEASEEDLFEYLITDDVPSGAHVVPITGRSGVGKSHTVRILNARLQSCNEDGRYVVIRIPKSASLRRVVELILEKLPEDHYAQVRAEFGKALSEDLDVETAVIRFQRELDISLDRLAKELRAKVNANPLDSSLKEQLGHALYLSKFMGDPVLVDHFRKVVFPRFVQRAIAGQQQVEKEELTKDFAPDDLIVPDSIDITKSAVQTNAYYTRTLLIKGREGMRVAARLLNENMVVDQAIRQLFSLHQSLGGMTLQDVILEIRRRLFAQGRELVIFVEDFKALTGIQDILLKVLIQEGVRDGAQELATLRSVIAVTDGYLDTEDTIATRAKREWKVESELSSSEEVLSRTKGLVAAYLNAARWGFKELVRHFETNSGTGSLAGPIGVYLSPEDDENSSILAAFGYQEGVPLFPYTEAAIEQLAKSALTRNNTLVFTPRFIVDNVLRSLLLSGRSAFEKGQFPSQSTITPPPTAEVAQWLASLPVSVELRERYRRVIAIWGNAPRSLTEVGYIPKEVFDAFKLNRPAIDFQAAPKAEEKNIQAQNQAQNTLQPRPDDDSLKGTLEKWVQGVRMPQSVANQIRKSVAIALNNRIDWASECCTKSPIQSSQISIPNAAGEAGLAASSIKVAEDHTDQSGQVRSELAAVVRLFHLNAGKRSYEDSDEDLIWVGNLVERLLPQARVLIRIGVQQKLSVALRFLSTNSRMLGLSLRGKTLGSLAPFLFSETSCPSEIPAGSSVIFSEWRSLQKQAQQLRPDLIQLVVSFCGCFQGTGKTPYAIDMIRVLSALQSTSGTPGVDVLELSSELKSMLVPMGESRVIPQARKVLNEAMAIRNKLAAEFGENFEKQEIVDEFRLLADQMGDIGVWPELDIGIGKIAFKNRCDEFQKTAIRESLVTLSAPNEDGGEQADSLLLSRMGRLDVNPLIIAAGFADMARRVVRAAEKHSSWLESQFAGVDPQAQVVQIQDLFQTLVTKAESFSAKGEAQ